MKAKDLQNIDNKITELKIKLDNIINDLKDIVNHKGRGTITEQSIRDIINKYGN